MITFLNNLSLTPKTTITCRACAKPITKSSDLITAFYLFKIRPFHTRCYSEWLKTAQTFLLNNQPFNSVGCTVKTVFFGIFGMIILSFYIFILIYSGNNVAPITYIFILIWVLAASLGVFYRLYSYYRYEKPLKK